MHCRSLDFRLPPTPSSHSSSHHHFSLPPGSPGLPLTPGPHSAASSNSIPVFFSDSTPSSAGIQSVQNNAISGQTGKPLQNYSGDARQALHRELFESCMDLMSRYSTGSCSSVPQKNPQTDSLVDRSSSMTWLLGQQLITISTSNCTGKAVHNGYCKSCLQTIHSIPGVTTVGSSSLTSSVSSTLDDSDTEKNQLTDSGNFKGSNFENARKRHQSAIQPRTPSYQATSKRAFDDSHLENVIPSNSVVPSTPLPDGKQLPCIGWAQGWAEITIRRPAGKTSFVCRLGNALNLPCYCSSSCDNNSSVSMVNVYSPRILERTQSVFVPRSSRINSSCDSTSSSGNRSSLSSMTVNNNNSNSSSKRNSNNLEINSESFLVRDSGISSVSTTTSFRRTSSSPEIERQAAIEMAQASQAEEEVEEAREVKDDTCLSQSPSKGSLMRTVSLGKAESQTRKESVSPSRVIGSASFSMKKTSGPSVMKSSSPGQQRIDEGCVTSSQSPHGLLVSRVNKKNLQIDIPQVSPGSVTPPVQRNGLVRTSFSQQGSPTKTSVTPSKSTSPTMDFPSSGTASPSIGSSSSHGDVSRERVSSSSSMRERSHTISGSTAANSAPIISSRSPKPFFTGQFSVPYGQPQQQQQTGLPAADFHLHQSNPSGGLSPSFVFLQLFYNPSFNSNLSEKPVLLNKTIMNEGIERSLRNIDFITPYETHKIGIIYVAPGQENDKTAILCNSHGSYRYQNMLEEMATLIRLKDVNQETCYIGGLDQSDKLTDGKFAYCWHDHLTQVVFHVATLMPKKETDPNCNDKIRHICNDYVCIVYNESGNDFEKKTIAVSI